MNKITSTEHAIELLERAVEKMGADHVTKQYELDDDARYTIEVERSGLLSGTCRYFSPDGSEPECIIGQVIHMLGGGPNDVVEGSNSYGLPDETRHALGSMSNPAAFNALSLAQDKQDRGMPWGQVLDEVKSQLSLTGEGVTK